MVSKYYTVESNFKHSHPEFSHFFYISTQLPNLIHQITSGGKENSIHKMNYRIALEPIFKLVFIDGDYGQI